jgi:Tfp pilus assembly protein PilN
MRPVNLIPPEERRGDRAPARTGGAPYILLATLALAVAAIASVALVSKQISDRKAEVASLEARESEAAARAEALAPYAEFATLSQARNATVTSLAQSRFDWERVLRELALVIPSDVWLTELNGSAAGAAGEVGSGLGVSVAGPSLSMKGCGEGHESVAAFLQALKDIDGVTRVGVLRSEKPTGADGASAGSGGGETESVDCRTRNFISQFEVVVAFDAATVPAAPAAPTAPGTPAAPTEPAAETEIVDAQAQEQQARDAVAEQTGEAGEAADVVAGVAR